MLVTISIRLLAFLVAVAVATPCVLAQELPTGIISPGGSNHPGSSFAVETLEGYDQLGPQPQDLWDCEPVPTESSGTWLHRGFWYVETEAVVLNRFWSRDDLLMSAEDNAVNAPTFRNFRFGPNVSILNTNRLLNLRGAHPGADVGVRLTLGRFLFRDLENRDHTGEFTIFGAGDFNHELAITANNPNGIRLQVPFFLDGVNPSFDGSLRQTVAYSSTLNSFEANYRIKKRMRRDQMVMDPDGHWTRKASPTTTREFLIGLRILELRDILNWSAEDIAIAGADGQYNLRTDNDLVGLQFGGGLTYETASWSVGLHGKGGVFLTDALGLSDFSLTNNPDADFNQRMREQQMSFVGEAKILGKWHLMPHLSLRASYEMLYITSVALAPQQITFIPEITTLSTSGDPFYHGASFGLEGHW